MATKINRDILESFLTCRLKGHLKLTGQQGRKCDYEILRTEMREDVRRVAIDKIVSSHSENEIARNVEVTPEILKHGPSFVIDATFTDDIFILKFDGSKKVDGPSQLGDFHYLPVLLIEGEAVRQENKLLLAIYGSVIAAVQGRQPRLHVAKHSGLLLPGTLIPQLSKVPISEVGRQEPNELPILFKPHRSDPGALD